ncbi:hypothetical protein MRB53_031450 [Persea americana]|uniref:Uncharacterized protein n=1 Tax=Persea americana TaxID=3435 RepID=A0ACC2KP54_PERAE|nr:hypothetical protein MRB53_031450 [Persea americana]
MQATRNMELDWRGAKGLETERGADQRSVWILFGFGRAPHRRVETPPESSSPPLCVAGVEEEEDRKSSVGFLQFWLLNQNIRKKTTQFFPWVSFQEKETETSDSNEGSGQGSTREGDLSKMVGHLEVGTGTR